MGKNNSNLRQIYYGIFVDKDKVSEISTVLGLEKLEKEIEFPHVTFAFNNFRNPNSEIHNLPEEMFGQRVLFKIIGMGSDGQNAGFEVEIPDDVKHLYFNNSPTVHITTSIAEGAKPVNTGNIKFERLETPFEFEGYFSAFINGRPYGV